MKKGLKAVFVDGIRLNGDQAGGITVTGQQMWLLKLVAQKHDLEVLIRFSDGPRSRFSLSEREAFGELRNLVLKSHGEFPFR